MLMVTMDKEGLLDLGSPTGPARRSHGAYPLEAHAYAPCIFLASSGAGTCITSSSQVGALKAGGGASKATSVWLQSCWKPTAVPFYIRVL